ncbi:hypothetical protein AAFF_G00057940 [Aldrovandia affinis]|uniref:Uncharacterized protein n=1 Tax=Aldrovandia affinis TaxID=143900 RepID=A0AAD7S2U6_9TELE|nr:hypothetical protein AAFF_G00057940 [Aldrovandia affinis]
MGNVRSLNDKKIDELTTLLNDQREYWESSALCFTETWLHGEPDSAVELTGFLMVRADRDRTLSRKKSADRPPRAFLTINGDFNHAKLPKTLTGFTQYVKCSTRENKILDMMYANVKEAYSSSALLPWAPLTTT